jgi:signal transduction histidine kinase
VRHTRSLFWTIAGILLLTLIVGTLLQALVVVAVLEPLETRDARSRAELLASSIAGEIAARPGLPAAADLDTLLARHWAASGPHPPWIVYRGRDGLVVTAPPDRGRFLARASAGEAAPDSLARDPRRRGPQRRLETIARHPVARGDGVLGEVIVMRPTRPRAALEFLGPRTSLLFLPIAMIAAMVAGLVMVRMLVGRLRALELLAARIAEGDLSVRIADPREDEIGRVAERLDRMADRLADAHARVETSERERRQLFADITHELATPLTAIRGYAETLLDPHVTVSPDERTRYVRGVLDESRRLDRLIRDLFELARLEAGAAPLEREPLDWAALCRNTIERFEPRFRDARLRLVWRPALEEAWIEADGHRIEEVLENLLANALRYVPADGTVELSLARADGSGDRFALTMADDGPGLPAEERAHVFERFFRGAGARGTGGARDNGGSGLGLAIVREIVVRHGGSARAEACVPHGLSIIIELPARSAPNPS